ncbi:dTDP-glucose 4,6-dehydratase [[Eubacterium] cellulosolvens]
MTTVLVTGGMGFIGSNFVRYMLDAHPDYKVINLDKLTYAGNPENLRDKEALPNYTFEHGDICDHDVVEKCMKDSDYVINFAAETHVDRSIYYADEFVRTDVYGTFILLEAMRKFPVKMFVQISTDEVYGDCGATPSTEESPLHPKSPYAASKTGADRLAYSYWSTYDLPIIITRCTNNYGPYQYPEKLIPLFVTNAIEDKPLPVYGDGKNSRDWIYVLDHCKAIDVIMHSEGYEGEIFNIGANKELSVLEITDIILETLDKSADLINHIKDRLGHVRRHAVTTDKINQTLGWKPEYDFKTAMVETINWYVENKDWWWKIKYQDEDYKSFYKLNYEKSQNTQK